MKTLTGTKDIDREILYRADDRDILNLCQLNKYTSENVCDNKFFHNLLLKRYPALVNAKKYDESWKKLYIRMVKYIALLKEQYGIPYINNKLYNPEVIYRASIGKLHRNDPYTTAGIAASAIGDLDVLKYLFDNNKMYNDVTIVVEAIRKNQLPVAKYLLTQPIEHRDTYFNTALTIAARDSGNLEIAKYLVSQYNYPENEIEYNINLAEKRGHTQVAQYLKSLLR